MMNTTKLTIYFCGDPSVGIFPYSFTMEVPSHSLEDGNRDETLEWVKELYYQLDGDFKPIVYVDGEIFI